MRSKEFRMHENWKAKKEAGYRIQQWFPYGAEICDDRRFIGKWARTPHPCSCMGCGHRRKWEGKTRAEKIAEDFEICKGGENGQLFD